MLNAEAATSLSAGWTDLYPRHALCLVLTAAPGRAETPPTGSGSPLCQGTGGLLLVPWVARGRRYLAHLVIWAFLREQEHDAVPASFIVLDKHRDRRGHITDRSQPLLVHRGSRVRMSRLDDASSAAESAKDGLNAHARPCRDVVQGDVSEQPRRSQLDGGIENACPGPLRGRGPGGHRVRARRCPRYECTPRVMTMPLVIHEYVNHASSSRVATTRDNGGTAQRSHDTVAFRLWPPVAIDGPLLAGWMATLRWGDPVALEGWRTLLGWHWCCCSPGGTAGPSGCSVVTRPDCYRDRRRRR